VRGQSSSVFLLSGSEGVCARANPLVFFFSLVVRVCVRGQSSSVFLLSGSEGVCVSPLIFKTRILHKTRVVD
jgi:hypothetical protein